MKKQSIHTFIMGTLTLFSGYLYVVANTTFPQTIIVKESPLIDVKLEEERTLYYLNELRKGAGLIPLNSNPKLQLAAKNHAQYLIKNDKIGHYEEREARGYTGMFGSHRSIHAGYKTPMVIENVSSNNFNHKESVDGLMAAIYHRFGFLDFHVDEIGIGILQNRSNRDKTAFVYDMGNTKLEALCHGKKITPNAKKSDLLNNICADQKLKIHKRHFQEALYFHRYKNNDTVIYPFHGQVDVPPAFYEELPDPLPEHSVSGFPISMSFNESRFKSIKMISFKLFNSDGEEIKETIAYDHKTDPNKKLKKFEFALFPLQRLAWNSTYTVQAAYEVNGILKRKIWDFKTRKFNTPIHKVTVDNKQYTITPGEPAIFYFPPTSKRDILGSLKYPASLDISFIDKNTIKLVANEHTNKNFTLNLGQHQLILAVEE